MSKLLIQVDYGVVGSIIKGLKSQIKNLLNWLEELEGILDKAVLEKKEIEAIFEATKGEGPD